MESSSCNLISIYTVQQSHIQLLTASSQGRSDPLHADMQVKQDPVRPGMAGREWGMGNGECPYTGFILSETETLMYYQCKAYYFNTKLVPILCMLLRLLTTNAALYPFGVHNVNQLKPVFGDLVVIYHFPCSLFHQSPPSIIIETRF